MAIIPTKEQLIVRERSETSDQKPLNLVLDFKVVRIGDAILGHASATAIAQQSFRSGEINVVGHGRQVTLEAPAMSLAVVAPDVGTVLARAVGQSRDTALQVAATAALLRHPRLDLLTASLQFSATRRDSASELDLRVSGAEQVQVQTGVFTLNFIA